MNFNIDINLKQAVESFSWDESQSPLSIPQNDFDALVTEVSNRIIGAFDLKPTLEGMVNRELSLVETCYLIVQSQDSKIGPVTLTRIQRISQPEKTILAHTFKKLSENFIQVVPENLKTITLLFGIQRISELASKTIIALTPPATQIEQLEAALKRLIEMRSKFNLESQKEFLSKVDAQIQEKQEHLKALKSSLNEKVS